MPSSKNPAAEDAALDPSWLERLPREAALLACLGLSLFLLMTLVSFNPSDPGWSSSGTGEPIHNLVGAVGAWIADVLLSLCGYVAFLLPLAVLMIGLRVFQSPPDDDAEEPDRIPRGVRIAAWAVLLISLSAIAALHVGASEHWAPQGSGGIAGLALAQMLVGAFSAFGASLVLLTVAAVAAPLALSFSWIDVAERLGSWALRQQQNLRNRIADFGRHAEPAAASPTNPTDPLARAPTAPTLPEPLRRSPVLSNPQPQPVEPLPPPRKVQPTVTLAGAGAATTAADPPEAFALHPSPPPVKKAKPKSSGSGIEIPVFDGDPLPPLSVLDAPQPSTSQYTQAELDQLSRDVERHLASFGVKAEVVDATPGPVITRFEIQPAPGVKGSQITNLSRDLARSLSVSSVRVIEVIEGKSVIGLEIPNHKREMVMLREILDCDDYRKSDSPLTISLGKDIAGEPVVINLGKMPHLLVAGTTGSGKSVAINAMILSMLFKATHEQLRFILIDPKMLELSVYEGIPHLLTPVVTDMKDAGNALRWSVAEMERRYRLMSALGVRNLAGLNAKVEEAMQLDEPIRDPLFNPNKEMYDPDAGVPQAPLLEPLPHIVIIIDELADMMMVVGKKVEELIARLTQKARAAGIHLIVATQRPSVDVITGLIKANIPSRLAFQVASRIDSRTILDEMGAETLLGHGDGLFRPIGASRLDRIHGAFVDDHEVHKVVGYIKQVAPPNYIDDICADEAPEVGSSGSDSADGEADPLYDQAVAVVLESGKSSISYVQRRLKVGYNRAARMVEQMESAGIIGPSGAGGNREILVPHGGD
ncbi:DNA translocase FtsK [Sinimarinibacterium sp. NLF-5-8]|uniref:DNA translocase FtsK n=1 Tax=Sinimarinibacterium sp. NLF-5-8 TaxID=2698684 RepID=UPI00137BAD76|nr:DNA translocase FtsK [Sinimarinibacterium sp. NLF-5-8]QHS09451.1 DNA translocase FtsK [Sinimarinibacterium sp. NLF-5-8]